MKAYELPAKVTPEDKLDLKLFPEVKDRRQQLELLKQITERMQQNPLPLEASPLTREALHERG
ncbi:MAG TPA: DUF104 domain-containing protein [Anaerolineae bacterium]|nr:DUF104 domain-containing protein [Anaerolineae bacterium]